MGHLASKPELLEQLRHRLDRNPIGVPPHPAMKKILDILFTEEEALVGSKFPMLVSSFEEVEQATGITGERLHRILTSMADKGLIIDRIKNGQTYYMLSPPMIGFFEFTFMRINPELPQKQLAELMHEYRMSEAAAKEFFDYPTSRTRVIPYEQVLHGVQHQVLPYEKAAEIIHQAGYGSLQMCYCRHEAQHLGTVCENPIEDICMSLGSAADYLIRHGFARRANLDELLDVLEQAEECGLVHISDNIQQELTFICNCCGCCCGLLSGINDHHIPGAVAASNYIAKVNTELCTACGTCEERCQIYAVKVTDMNQNAHAEVDAELCFGCGVCTAGCPTGAMSLILRDPQVEPPMTLGALLRKLIQERGKMAYYRFK